MSEALTSGRTKWPRRRKREGRGAIGADAMNPLIPRSSSAALRVPIPIRPSMGSGTDRGHRGPGWGLIQGFLRITAMFGAKMSLITSGRNCGGWPAGKKLRDSQACLSLTPDGEESAWHTRVSLTRPSGRLSETSGPDRDALGPKIFFDQTGKRILGPPG